MILSRALRQPARDISVGPKPGYTPAGSFPSYASNYTRSKQTVTPDTARSVATAYRAGNIISDDIAKMPLQLYRKKSGGQKEQVAPDARARNTPYLLEVSPNIWGWTPFQFKKAIAEWLIWYGNSYVWSPPERPPQKLILPADTTYPVFDKDGDLWYFTTWSNGKSEYIPSAEILHLLINPDNTGHVGRGVITFARESLGRQLGAYETESQLYAEGMNPAGYVQMDARLDGTARDEIRKSFSEAVSGSAKAGRLAVFDNRVIKYEPISMKLVDAQFLETIGGTDRDIANFFGMPLHMLNMGKEAYNSNEQKYNEYLSSTLDAYLVQIEQAARIKWLPLALQDDHYFKFVRESLLRMDGKARAEMNEVLIRSAQRNPNECREKDDYAAYADGEKFYMTANYEDVKDFGGEDAKNKK